MWSKILTIINTILLVTIIGGGAFGAQQYLSQQDLSRSQLEMLQSKLLELEKQQKDILENPIFSFESELGATLELAEDQIVGFTDVQGFLTEEELQSGEEKIKISYINFTNPSDKKIEEYIDTILQDGASSQFGKKDSFYYMALGCSKDNEIANQNMKLTANALGKIQKASQESPIRMRLFVGPYPEKSNEIIADECLSIVRNLQIDSDNLAGTTNN